MTTILISRFFLDLREANDTDTSSSATTNGISSTISFALARIAGNLGEPLDPSTNTWVSGTQDDIAEDADDDERFSSVVYSIHTRADESFREHDHSDVGSSGGAEDTEMAEPSVGSASRDLSIAIA